MTLTWCRNSEQQNLKICVTAYKKKSIIQIIMRSFAICTYHQIM